MRNGSLSLLILAVIAMAAVFFIPIQDNSSQPQADQSITVSGELVERSFQGIPGTTPPSTHSVTDNGTTYYLLFSDDATRASVTAGTNVKVIGVLKHTESETPTGARNIWTVIEVKSISALP